jgi:hypothetical protein
MQHMRGQITLENWQNAIFLKNGQKSRFWKGQILQEQAKK